MAASILVAYATRYGSTQEVAEAVAAELGSCGHAVDFQPARGVRDVAPYRAVVLGAPLYMFHWHKEAHQFLARHREALARIPVAVFALGPLKDEAKDWQDIRANLDKELARYAWLHPAAVKIIGGRFDPAKLSFPYNLIPALRNMPPSDLRDWDAIRAWAGELAARLEPAPA